MMGLVQIAIPWIEKLTQYFTPKGPFTLCVFMRFCLQFDANGKIGFYTHSLRLTQHPIDTMLQFDPDVEEDATAHA